MKLIYENSWMTYDAGGAIRIFEDERECYHIQYGASSVYSSADDHFWDDFMHVVDLEAVIEVMDDWAKITQVNEEYWNRNGGF